MAASSLPSSTIRWKYDVFLSFRGEDTRNRFTDHLYHALNQKGIVTFRDNETLTKGTKISSELLRGIEESRYSIIIFSKNYASSAWCLDELVKIVDCMEKNQQKAFPVFYDIDPSDVRRQTGDFKEAFDVQERLNKEKVEKWRLAMTKVANLSGWNLRNRSESQLIQEIVKKISKLLDQIFSGVAEGLVGIRSRVKELINNYLEVELDDVRFIGIWGMGGIGKTTIAKALYETLSNQYDDKCFLANVKEVSKTKGMEYLQERILYKVLKESNLRICDVYDGINLIRRRLCQKKVLLVLDDVDQPEQLKALCEAHNSFGYGSRIIITTRDEHLLISHGVKSIHIYKVEGLDNREAEELFYLKAFKDEKAIDDHLVYSRQIINYAQGLPLALEVLGSFLCGRSVEEWKSALERFRKYPNEKILKVLRISYDGLEEIEKKIFLDIACFFNGKKKDQVMQILDDCGFSPVIGIRVLIEKSLIKILNNEIWMHDLLQQMGFEIVREQHPLEPGKWSRLWQYDDIHHVLKENKGTSAVEGIFFNNPKEETTKFDGKSFSNMRNMRLLKISNIHFSEELEYLSNELCFLKWKGYPLKSLPSSFYPRKIVQLIMYSSCIEYLWKGIKIFEKLKTIKLCHSCKLIRTPDFTGVPNLEMLDLEGCISLLEVHQSIGLLKSLTVLNLKNCKNLVNFLSSVHGLISLKKLVLNGCSKLEELPHDLGEAKSLEELDVSGIAIRQVPSYILQLTNLKRLSFGGHGRKSPKTLTFFSKSLKMSERIQAFVGLQLPPFKVLSSLKQLDLNDCDLSEGTLPSALGSLSLLEELDLRENNFISLPESIKQLSQLKILRLGECQRLESLPQLPPNIVYLEAEGCTSLETLPSTFLEFCTSREIELHFLNCLKLFKNQGIADLFLRHWLQEFSDDESQFYITLPGSEIPKWFSHWRNDCSIEVQLPCDWFNGNLLGFAVCVVFALSPGFSSEDPLHITWLLKVGKQTFFIEFDLSSFRRIDSDHLALGFMSLKKIENEVEYPGRHVQCSFAFYDDKSQKSSFVRHTFVKKCGIRLVYKQDVEYLRAHHNLENMLPDEDSIGGDSFKPPDALPSPSSIGIFTPSALVKWDFLGSIINKWKVADNNE